MDSRLILPMLVAGWISATVGIWGACVWGSSGMYWWIFPLSAGIGLLAGGGFLLWAATHPGAEEPAAPEATP